MSGFAGGGGGRRDEEDVRAEKRPRKAPTIVEVRASAGVFSSS